jgi:ribonuclease P protein component
VVAKFSITVAPKAASGLRSEAFHRRARLAGGSAFGVLLRSRRSARSERFLVQAVANGEEFARLGVVVGKRVAKRAVDRSLLKRLVREIFRRQQHELGGFDLLVRLRRVVAADEIVAAREELRRLLAAAIT